MHEITTRRAWFAIVVDLLPDCDSRWPGRSRRDGGVGRPSPLLVARLGSSWVVEPLYGSWHLITRGGTTFPAALGSDTGCIFMSSIQGPLAWWICSAASLERFFC